jgi:hypothetical protein
VTTPLEEVVPIVAPRLILFAVREIALAADTLRSSVRLAPVDVIDTEPDVELMSAAELVVMFPDPEIKMLPEACRAPVGAMDVPPLMVTVPLVAVRVPAPE